MPRKQIDWPTSGQVYTMRDFVNHLKQVVSRIEVIEERLDILLDIHGLLKTDQANDDAP